ncbi:probable polyamine oxidase 5 [Phtheirospermum japonicum]|uniref:Probable polyamine oxidase 5 n=1 Tax=Phtheirospermum japonicum TaxID=374723 RepID=A0A830C261_9LAMI|nr:probable polyamine oxidase 5 [Phtheirospermum japonicum]
MVSRKPRIVIIGAGMAGLTAANKLYTAGFELAVVEGGSRIGGRINTSSFCGDRIELGATWIHGIENSPVYKIAQETGSLHSDEPWECMDGVSDSPVTVAEGGHVLSPSLVEPVSALFQNLMDFVQGKADNAGVGADILKHFAGSENLSVGSFLRKGLEAHWAGPVKNDVAGLGNWTRRSLEEAVFAMHESIQRTFTSAGDLRSLDYNAEREYVMFPGEEITIAKGYSSVVESLASVLPAGVIQLGRRVERIEWMAKGNGPVTLHFSDGSVMSADHVIVTVSLGVLKRGISPGSGFFSPALPNPKARAISRLGYGVVNKVFLKMSQENIESGCGFPFLQMVFHPQDSEFRNPKIPHWIRKTSFLSPVYSDSSVVLSWFTGQEALELESLSEAEIINGFDATVSNLLSGSEVIGPGSREVRFEKVMRSQWGTNPLFLGSYSYVAVGSSTDDMDTLAEPLPQMDGQDESAPPLQILFAGEATHRTHYSTTHGAYFSGLREANRLLKHYNFIGE